MKKFLTFLMATVLAIPSLWAQQPDAIYIGTWVTMTGDTGLGTPITPNTSDPKLIYNETTGCYEGNLYDWAKTSGTTAWNAKIPYSVDGDVITYYSGTTPANISFNSKDTYTGTFTPTTSPTGLKGYNIAAANSEAVVAASISINLTSKSITITKIENVSQAPELISVDPKDGTVLTPEVDGSAKITLTFDGAVTSMRVLVEGEDAEANSSESGTVWTIFVTKDQIQESTREGGGTLNIKIDQVYANSTPVSFNGNTILYLKYLVKGISQTATLNLSGYTNVLTAYSSNTIENEDVQFLNGVGTVDMTSSDTYEFPISTVQRYLFTVPQGFEISVTSDLPEGTSTWTKGTMWTQQKYVDEENDDDNAEIIFFNVAEGTYVCFYPAAVGKTFNLTVEVSDKGSKDIYASGAFNGYNPNNDATYKIAVDTDMENDEDIDYTKFDGSFEVPDGQFSLNFLYGNKILIPAAGKSTALTFNQDGYDMKVTVPYAEGLLSDSANSKVYWTLSDWTANTLYVSIDTETKTISFQYDAPVDDTVWWLSGAFNDYKPGTGATWALYEQSVFDGDNQNGLYAGQFNIPAGQLSFNFINPTKEIFCPYNEYMEGENKTITFTNGSYSSQAGMAYPEYGEDTMYWSDSSWKGGELVFVIDGNNGKMEVSLPKVYLSGDFNEYLPKGGFTAWQLVPTDTDDSICVGYFDIPAGNFSINFKYGLNSYFVPGSDTALTFSNGTASASFTEGDGSSYWTCSGFVGGKVKITLNQTDKTISFEVVNPYVNISGSGAVELNASSDDDAAGIYVAYIPVTEDTMKFNFLYGETYYIPTSAAATSSKPLAVTLTDNAYTGKYKAGASNIFWQVSGLSEGELFVEFNTTDETLSLQFIPAEEDKWYIRGEFNNYDPAGDETWALTPATEDEDNVVFTGTFQVPAGQLSFNFLAPNGMVYVPASSIDTGKGEIIAFEPTSGDDEVMFSSRMDYAIDETEEGYYWYSNSWIGGDVQVTINTETGTLDLIVDEYFSGVESLDNINASDNVIYNLQGVRVNNPAKGGIYIINGKKVLVK